MTPSVPPSSDASKAEWLSYADDLSAKNDPEGELIRLNHAVAVEGEEERAARDTHLQRHGEALLGPLASHLSQLSLQWWWNEIIAAEVRLSYKLPHPEVIMEALLSSPRCGRLESLTIVGEPAPDVEVPPIESRPGVSRNQDGEVLQLDSVLERMVELELPKSCTALTLVDGRAQRSDSVISLDYGDLFPNRVDFGSLQLLWDHCDHLESLRLIINAPSQVDFGSIRAPHLKRFSMENLGPWIPPALLSADWPKLQNFSMSLNEAGSAFAPDRETAYSRPYKHRDPHWPTAENDVPFKKGYDWSEAVQALLQNLHKSELRTLRLSGFESGRTVINGIRWAGLPPTLKELDFSGSSFSDEHLQDIDLRGSVLDGLSRLVVERTPLSPASLERLRQVLGEVVHSAGSGAASRFIVGFE